MSSGDYGDFMATGQVISQEMSDNQNRLFKVWADIGEVVLIILTCAAARLIGKRLALLADAAWLPGMGDARMIGAMTNKSDRTIEGMVAAEPREKLHVGQQVYYRFADIAISGKVARVKRTGKKTAENRIKHR